MEYINDIIVNISPNKLYKMFCKVGICFISFLLCVFIIPFNTVFANSPFIRAFNGGQLQGESAADGNFGTCHFHFILDNYSTGTITLYYTKASDSLHDLSFWSLVCDGGELTVNNSSGNLKISLNNAVDTVDLYMTTSMTYTGSVSVNLGAITVEQNLAVARLFAFNSVSASLTAQSDPVEKIKSIDYYCSGMYTSLNSVKSSVSSIQSSVSAIQTSNGYQSQYLNSLNEQFKQGGNLYNSISLASSELDYLVSLYSDADGIPYFEQFKQGILNVNNQLTQIKGEYTSLLNTVVSKLSSIDSNLQDVHDSIVDITPNNFYPNYGSFDGYQTLFRWTDDISTNPIVWYRTPGVSSTGDVYLDINYYQIRHPSYPDETPPLNNINNSIQSLLNSSVIKFTPSIIDGTSEDGKTISLAGVYQSNNDFTNIQQLDCKIFDEFNGVHNTSYVYDMKPVMSDGHIIYKYVGDTGLQVVFNYLSNGLINCLQSFLSTAADTVTLLDYLQDRYYYKEIVDSIKNISFTGDLNVDLTPILDKQDTIIEKEEIIINLINKIHYDNSYAGAYGASLSLDNNYSLIKSNYTSSNGGDLFVALKGTYNQYYLRGDSLFRFTIPVWSVNYSIGSTLETVSVVDIELFNTSSLSSLGHYSNFQHYISYMPGYTIIWVWNLDMPNRANCIPFLHLSIPNYFIWFGTRNMPIYEWAYDNNQYYELWSKFQFMHLLDSVNYSIYGGSSMVELSDLILLRHSDIQDASSVLRHVLSEYNNRIELLPVPDDEFKSGFRPSANLFNNIFDGVIADNSFRNYFILILCLLVFVCVVR